MFLATQTGNMRQSTFEAMQKGCIWIYIHFDMGPLAIVLAPEETSMAEP